MSMDRNSQEFAQFTKETNTAKKQIESAALQEISKRDMRSKVAQIFGINPEIFGRAVGGYRNMESLMLAMQNAIQTGQKPKT